MPATRSRRARGISPIGDSVPSGVSTRHDVADRDAELRREVLAEQDAVGDAPSSARVRERVERCRC